MRLGHSGPDICAAKGQLSGKGYSRTKRQLLAVTDPQAQVGSFLIRQGAHVVFGLEGDLGSFAECILPNGSNADKVTNFSSHVDSNFGEEQTFIRISFNGSTGEKQTLAIKGSPDILHSAVSRVGMAFGCMSHSSFLSSEDEPKLSLMQSD